jgi:hypothetical protein
MTNEEEDEDEEVAVKKKKKKKNSYALLPIASLHTASALLSKYFLLNAT